ncbi:MAG TPA: phosphate ABC transporter ATP-binding protein, partial [Candidatus Limnocylindrales bacterium]
GSGKSTLLRCIDRMHEVVPGARVTGTIKYRGIDIYGGDVDAGAVRRAIGMVFQQPNPFPTMSIFDNVAAPARFNGAVKGKSAAQELVERCLRQAALWDEVKDKLNHSGTSLSGGQQQRLCIARALALAPDVLLMDEPCSALDPVATLQVEQLMTELRKDYTIVIVTHNMQQAARVSDETVFFTMGEDRAGYLVERGPTSQMFTNPKNQLTDDYVSGRFG